MKVVARPDAPLARLHSTTPVPTISHRDRCSDSLANTGAAIM